MQTPRELRGAATENENGHWNSRLVSTPQLPGQAQTCRACHAPIPLSRSGQRYCSKKCRQAQYRTRVERKAAVAVTRKRRLYPTTGWRNKNAEKAQWKQGQFLPPTYFIGPVRPMPPKRRGLLPLGPPPPLSAVEIAALGGFVVTAHPKPRCARTAVLIPDCNHGPTPGALQVDDVDIGVDVDGWPVMPAFLRRGRQ
jgi:hypothetical protein